MSSVRLRPLAVALYCTSFSFAAEEKFTPNPAAFAPLEEARYLSGELVYMDAVNRRGGIRIDGAENGRYWAGPVHYFALLPYAVIWQNGARAALRDVPLGSPNRMLSRTLM